jgi:hypothetical protein
MLETSKDCYLLMLETSKGCYLLMLMTSKGCYLLMLRTSTGCYLLIILHKASDISLNKYIFEKQITTFRSHQHK